MRFKRKKSQGVPAVAFAATLFILTVVTIGVVLLKQVVRAGDQTHPQQREGGGGEVVGPAKTQLRPPQLPPRVVSSEIQNDAAPPRHHNHIVDDDVPLDDDDGPRSKHETIQLRSGLDMPSIGYGTCCRSSSTGDAIYQSTKIYLANGGKLIDTAMAYNNHKEIGRAIRDSGVERESLWITSKIGLAVKGYDNTLTAVQNIKKNLGVEYLDLLLIHMPWNGKDETIQVWKALIEAKKRLWVASIGVSNFSKGEVTDIAEATGVWPEVNQIQYHPWSPPSWKRYVKWMIDEKDIAVTAYNSLGGSRFHHPQNGSGARWPDAVTKIAKSHGPDVSEVHVLLRWALTQNVAVVPGATSEAHIRENLNVPKFELTPDEMDRIEMSSPPGGWWHPDKGPSKFTDEEAEGYAWKQKIGR